MKKAFLVSLFFCCSLTNIQALAFSDADISAVQGVLISYLPEYYGFATPKVTKLSADQKSRTVRVSLSESGSYMPLTVESLAALKADIARSLPAAYRNYKVKVTVGKDNLDNLALFADKKYVAPSESHRFVTRLSDHVAAPSAGLDGSNIALWQSHGLYYQADGEWGWQRPHLWLSCEDLFTQSFVVPFLMPMLEGAGAYVMSPRERDTGTLEYIIDNDNPAALYAESDGAHGWSKAAAPGFAYSFTPLTDRQNPFTDGTARQAKAVRDPADVSTASWSADIGRDGLYAVYVSYQSSPKSVTDATYTVNAANGPHQVVVNQRMGGGTWIYLGHFPFKAGESPLPLVTLSNLSDHDGVVSADAVKIGGGMGNVARGQAPGADGVDYGYSVSGRPRFVEGARYWLQWAGAPDSVYSATDYTTEYNDDYRSRGLWVNWLAGGSSVLPKEEGLGIPVDLSFAFHSDAGITPGDSIVGTLGIYCNDNTDSYPNGTSRLAARDLTDLVLTSVTNDVRATFEPQWTRRGMWNRSYAEARVPQVPAMLLELLSHQNFADMKYGLDPAFRFVVSRAVYKAMLRFIAHRDGRDYVVQPLPVRAFAITDLGDGSYRLSWQPRADSLEPTATPTYYIVEHRPADGLGFTPVAVVPAQECQYTVRCADSDIHSYRIVAANQGGVSFPSEVLALRNLPGRNKVLVVNGFTRVSAPDWIDTDEIDGFLNAGVPYICDISYVGEQTEMRRSVPWMANEVAGLGASRSDYDDKVIAGNTFDFVAVHGQAISEAGYGFVSSSLDAFVEGGTPAQPVLDLIMGNQREIQQGTGRYGTRFKTFPEALQARLGEYTRGGGSVFVSGSYIGTDLWCNTFSSDRVKAADTDFARKVLGYEWRASDASDTGEIVSTRSRFGMFDSIGVFGYCDSLNDRVYAVYNPGSISPSGKDGAVVMRYTSGRLPAATAYEAANYRTVAMGVPFETVDADARTPIMRAVLQFLCR